GHREPALGLTLFDADTVDTLLRYGLLAVFIALLLTPFGLPVPEDVSLFVAGVLTGLGQAVLPQALAVGYVGVVVSDLISFSFGRRVGLEPRGFLGRLVGPSQLARIERFYLRYGSWAIVIARQIPGMRLPAFFFAGATGIPLTRFLLVDGSAAFVTVGVYVSLGYGFSDKVSSVVPWLDRFRFVLVLVGVTSGLVIALRWFRRHRRSG
ncbi:MAG: DedA family protein, partial [Oligoflexia bacterium]|nr:DedA family protein [Oligoflexia bacterium]